MADANKIVLLFPQVVTSYYLPTNPKGCWDWWGYNDSVFEISGYNLKKGPQMKAIYEMIQDLGSGGHAE